MVVDSYLAYATILPRLQLIFTVFTFRFSKEMHKLLMDNQIAALIFVILVFNSNRESLSTAAKAMIDETREQYILYSA